jgi:DNA-binding CsgD family transcriptional regulator
MDSLAFACQRLIAAKDERNAVGIIAETPALVGALFVGVVEDIALNPASFHPDGMPLNAYFGWPAAFLTNWQRGFSRLHPAVARCRFEAMPFVSYEDRQWRELQTLSPQQRRLRADLANLSITAVLVVPVHLPKGKTAALMWSGSHGEPFESVVRDQSQHLISIAHVFMARRQATVRSIETLRDLTFLTPRQIEMIRFASEGKTISETADILGLSSHTVRKHLRAVFERLNAVNITHAVAIAAQFGLLAPDPR